jgi:hypothetical protein
MIFRKAGLGAIVALSLVAVITGCGGGKGGAAVPTVTPTPDPNEPQATKDARVKYPRFLDLQVNLLSTTCSPNPGVCHNSGNYPNFQTAGNTIAFINAPCNVEIPDPLQGWDNCERKADHITLGSEVTKIAFTQRIGPGTWHLGFKDASGVSQSIRPTIRSEAGDVILDPPVEWGVMVTTTAGSAEANLSVGGDDFIHDFVDSVLKTIVSGDPNRNGIWGADDPVLSLAAGKIFAPGSPDRSYMFGRITATVPGTRMPLANTPITEPGYIAIACWIEGLKTDGSNAAEDAIDYSHCQFAKNPVDYTATLP